MIIVGELQLMNKSDISIGRMSSKAGTALLQRGPPKWNGSPDQPFIPDPGQNGRVGIANFPRVRG
jgi:hypothetical protein